MGRKFAPVMIAPLDCPRSPNFATPLFIRLTMGTSFSCRSATSPRIGKPPCWSSRLARAVPALDACVIIARWCRKGACTRVYGFDRMLEMRLNGHRRKDGLYKGLGHRGQKRTLLPIKLVWDPKKVIATRIRGAHTHPSLPCRVSHPTPLILTRQHPMVSIRCFETIPFAPASVGAFF